LTPQAHFGDYKRPKVGWFGARSFFPRNGYLTCASGRMPIMPGQKLDGWDCVTANVGRFQSPKFINQGMISLPERELSSSKNC